VGFKFRFAPVLSYRAHLRDRAEMDFARARKVLARELEALRRSRALLAEEETSFQKAMSASLPGDRLRTHIEYRSALERRIALQEEKVSRARRVAAEKKRALIEAERTFRLMKKLEERDWESWRTEENLLEQKRLDEISVTRYGREFP